MAVVTTKAIVLSTIKFGDTSLIVKCFTEKEGVKTYLIKGALSAKKGKLKAAYFQPLTQLFIEANHNNKGNLNSIKEVHIAQPFKDIYTNIFKQTIVVFLSEILSKTIQEEEENNSLFEYLESSFIWLDTHQQISNFHLLFLLNLTRYLGFYPDISESNKEGFNLLEGCFTQSIHAKEVITGENLALFKKLFNVNFDTIHTVLFHKNERQQVLKILIQYYQLHLDGFKTPKSLSILETVFH